MIESFRMGQFSVAAAVGASYRLHQRETSLEDKAWPDRTTSR
jgi:hypothetical protein